MNVSDAKYLIDSGIFLRHEGGHNYLHDKLMAFLRFYFSDACESEEEPLEFEHYFSVSKRMMEVNLTGKSSGRYDNIGCNEEGWSWFCVTGPRESSEYYYSGYFEYDIQLFLMSYEIYRGLFKDVEYEKARERIEAIIACKTLSEMCSKVMELSDDYMWYDMEEYVNEYINQMEFEYVPDEETGEEDAEYTVNEIAVARCMVYGAYYLYHYLETENGSMDAKYDQDWMKCSDIMFGECSNGSGAYEEYFDSFLDEVDTTMECSDEGKRIYMRQLMHTYFAFDLSEHEYTPTVYAFKSSHMKEYKTMKENGLKHELTDYMDKLLQILEEPAFMISKSFVFEGRMTSGECYMEYGYTNSEYVCSYLYFDESEDDTGKVVEYHYLFSLARNCFEVLFKEIQKDVVKLEECA